MNPSSIPPQVVADEVDGRLNEWRSKTARVVLWIGGIASLPALLVVFSGRAFHLPWFLQLLCGLVLLVVVTATLKPKLKRSWRVGVILSTLALFGIIQLAVTGLTGGGRLSLLALPLVAVILSGPRSGWLMTAASLSLYAIVAGATQTGVLAEWQVAEMTDTSVVWFLQGLRLASEEIFLMALLTLFQSLQRRTMIAERIALKKLEAESANRRRLEAEVARVSEAERRNLGSELHDGLCQTLTAALLNCTALENRQAASGSPEAMEVARIREALEESIDTAYDVARGLCPVDLESEGLASALESLCHAVRERRSITCDLHVDNHVAVCDPDCALQLYRIAGEAIANAIKHAACTRVAVRVARHPDELVLSVADNGKGISGESGEGLGRQIMAYRAGLIGGSLAISGAPGQGTTVTCRVPDPEAGA